jgi:4-amino-4-deoxychorismate lyase
MCLLLETIKVVDRHLFNIDAHNRRAAASRLELFGASDTLDLGSIEIPPHLGAGVYKCRVLYDTEIRSVEFQPYAPRILRTLRLRAADDLEYRHKYADRSRFDELLAGADADDVLIVRQGRLTDLTFANIVFSDGHNWVTPAQPLLNGTKRQLLLARGDIREEPLAPADLSRFTVATPINAMLGLGEGGWVDVGEIRW